MDVLGNGCSNFPFYGFVLRLGLVGGGCIHSAGVFGDWQSVALPSQSVQNIRQNSRSSGYFFALIFLDYNTLLDHRTFCCVTFTLPAFFPSLAKRLAS